nr:hypothetical protein Iba_chr06fCG8710 [Ipomoea batatas]
MGRPGPTVKELEAAWSSGRAPSPGTAIAIHLNCYGSFMSDIALMHLCAEDIMINEYLIYGASSDTHSIMVVNFLNANIGIDIPRTSGAGSSKESVGEYKLARDISHYRRPRLMEPRFSATPAYTAVAEEWVDPAGAAGARIGVFPRQEHALHRPVVGPLNRNREE